MLVNVGPSSYVEPMLVQCWSNIGPTLAQRIVLTGVSLPYYVILQLRQIFMGACDIHNLQQLADSIITISLLIGHGKHDMFSQAGLMLGQRPRRWPNIKLTEDQRCCVYRVFNDPIKGWIKSPAPP